MMPLNKQKLHVPMLIKASLKNHSPEEIYDFLFRHVGQLGIKIKKKQAVIGFQNQDYYDKLLRDHKTIMLHGKKLQFIPIPKSDENEIQSQQEEVIEIKKSNPEVSESKYIIPDFKAKNNLQSIANRYRYDMHQKVEELFNSTLTTTRRRVQQFRLEIKDQAPRQRQVCSLQALLQNKLKPIQSRYQTDLNKLNQSIQQFSMRANNIDLEPTFTFAQNWQFPKINQGYMKFQQSAFYKNPEYQHACKRLCAINGNQFAVTMSSIRTEGKIKIYDVNKSDAMKTIIADPGVYGICRIKNYLIIGGIDSTIKYIDLQDSEGILNTTRRLINIQKVFFQMKILKYSDEKPEILALSTDNIIRKFQISIDDMGHGLKDLSFEQKQSISVTECCTFQILNPNVIVFGKDSIMRKYQIEKKIFKDIKINGKPLKIKKFNSNLCAVASQGVIQLADMRTQTVVQKFPFMPKQLRSLEVLGQHSLMYGGPCQIGLLDDRKPSLLPWKSQAHHKDIVYDILKLQNIVVSCDKAGGMYGWKLASQNPIQPISIQLG